MLQVCLRQLLICVALRNYFSNTGTDITACTLRKFLNVRWLYFSASFVYVSVNNVYSQNQALRILRQRAKVYTSTAVVGDV